MYFCYAVRAAAVVPAKDTCRPHPCRTHFVTMTASRADIIRHLITSQDDNDTVVLPNACQGELIQLNDATVRCFSVLTRQPHMVPPESWSLVQTDTMPKVKTHKTVTSGLMVDNVTRGIMGSNAFQLTFDDHGAITHMRLLPPNDGSAQQQWEAQAAKMIT